MIPALIPIRNTVIETQRPYGEIQPEADTDRSIEFVRCVTVVEGLGVEEADVMENSAAHAVDDGEGQLHVRVGHGIAAQGLGVLMDRADAVVAKSAHGARPTNDKPIKERDFRAVAVKIHIA